MTGELGGPPRLDLSQATTAQLQAELDRRSASEWCRCGKWRTRVSGWDHLGVRRRCSGCMSVVESCRC